MEEKNAAKLMLPPVSQVGIVVKDVAKSVKFYSSVLGIGPWTIRDYKVEGATLRGKTTNFEVRVGFAQSGQVQIELVQPLAGETPHAEFLRQEGEGLHHLCFYVENLEDKLAQLSRQGIKPFFYYSGTEANFHYFDNIKMGGVMIELAPASVRTFQK